MKKALLFAAMLGVLVAPATAGAASFSGVLVAKDPNRKAIVTASPNGVARTVYVGNALPRLALGRKVAVNATPRPDGTFTGKSIRVLGRAGKAKLRAVIVRDDRRAGKYLVSAGGSTFALRTGTRRLASASQTPLAPGTPVTADVTQTPAGPAATNVTPTGQAAAAVPLSGIFLGVADGKLQLAVLGKGLVTIAVPAGFTLPALAPGDLVSLTANPDATGALTLATIEKQTLPAPGNDGRGGIHVTITIVNTNTNANSNTNSNSNSNGSRHDDDDDDSDDSDDDSDDTDDD